MPSRYEVRLAGSGGQGLILAGIILAEAGGIYDGKFVCQTQSYGPEARGGASKAEVVISDAEIDYPKAIQPDVLLAMNQKSLDAFIVDLKPGGLLLVDADLVKEVPASRSLALPFTRIARDWGGRWRPTLLPWGPWPRVWPRLKAGGRSRPKRNPSNMKILWS
ncbi:MAG: 2-oxoacid:acceptor oxidoreductase family protein [Desulfobaccales bacterium]